MSHGGTELIRLEGVKKVFFTDEVETHALSDIHLKVPQGEYLSIAGPSGCGKSTLLSIIGLLDSPTAGEYMLDDMDVVQIVIIGMPPNTCTMTSAIGNCTENSQCCEVILTPVESAHKQTVVPVSYFL